MNHKLAIFPCGILPKHWPHENTGNTMTSLISSWILPEAFTQTVIARDSWRVMELLHFIADNLDSVLITFWQYNRIY